MLEGLVDIVGGCLDTAVPRGSAIVLYGRYVDFFTQIRQSIFVPHRYSLLQLINVDFFPMGVDSASHYLLFFGTVLLNNGKEKITHFVNRNQGEIFLGPALVLH